MNISKIHIGDVIKNYYELCNALEVPIKGGCSKKCQLNDFKRYFDWEKEGQKFIITKIYESPLEKVINRGNNLGHYRIDNGTYCVDKSLNMKFGVYKIQLGNDVYIGSTINNFRQRYTQHYQNRDNLMPHTQEMIQNGGKYEILWVAPQETTEDDVRIKEQYFIDTYKSNPQYNVINGKDVDIPKFRKKKIKKKKITIKANDYEFARQLLKQNGIEIFEEQVS